MSERKHMELYRRYSVEILNTSYVVELHLILCMLRSSEHGVLKSLMDTEQQSAPLVLPLTDRFSIRMEALVLLCPELRLRQQKRERLRLGAIL